jgi:hypothetical protein
VQLGVGAEFAASSLLAFEERGWGPNRKDDAALTAKEQSGEGAVVAAVAEEVTVKRPSAGGGGGGPVAAIQMIQMMVIMRLIRMKEWPAYDWGRLVFLFSVWRSGSEKARRGRAHQRCDLLGLRDSPRFFGMARAEACCWEGKFLWVYHSDVAQNVW